MVVMLGGLKPETVHAWSVLVKMEDRHVQIDKGSLSYFSAFSKWYLRFFISYNRFLMLFAG